MFIEVTTTTGPILLNLNHVISISDASDLRGGGCFIETISKHLRVQESFSDLEQYYTALYNDKSRIR